MNKLAPNNHNPLEVYRLENRHIYDAIQRHGRRSYPVPVRKQYNSANATAVPRITERRGLTPLARFNHWLQGW
jgi:hypothetical protein